MIDSFIDGEVELEEVLSRMQEEKKHSRAVNKATANNKRISEMFAREKPKTKQVNKSAFVTLQDFLDDMEDESLSAHSSSNDSEPKLLQTALPYARLEAQVAKALRIAKSLTLAAVRPEDIKR